MKKMIFSLEYYSPWLVWLFPISCSPLVPLFSKFGSKARDKFVTACGIITLVLSSSMIFGSYSVELVKFQNIRWIPIADIELGLYLDPLSILFTNLIALIGLIVLIYSLSYMAHEEGLMRYYSLVLLFIGSMIGLVIADNFLQMFIFWEVVGLCSYALISFWYKKPEAVKAGTKVFLMTKVGDVALLAGILLLYSNLHTFSYKQVFDHYGTMAVPAFTTISFLVLFGSLVKSAQLPLHTWLYSAMEAPTSVSCLLHGATMVKGGVYLIARTHVMFSSIPLWLNCVAWAGVVTALIGGTLALHTPDIKGVPAYSTMSQNGFIMLALGVASSPGDLGWFAGIYHMVSHAFFQGLGFLAIGGIVHQLDTRDMRDMGGLRDAMPITFAFSMIVVLSRSGIPPFSGFFSKGLIAKSVMATGDIALILLMYSAAAITFAYSYRSMILTFAGQKSNYLKGVEVHEAPGPMIASAGILAAGCLILGLVGETLARFFGINFVFDGVGTFGPESVMLMITLLIGGLPIYLLYQRKAVQFENLRKGTLAFLDSILENGYFFDYVYERIVGGFINISNFLSEVVEAKVMAYVPYIIGRGFARSAQGVRAIMEMKILGIIPDFIAGCFARSAQGVRGVVELKILGALPDLIAVGTMKLSVAALRCFDAALDRITYMVTEAALLHSPKIRRMNGSALPRYVLAAALGLLLLCVLLLLNVGG